MDEMDGTTVGLTIEVARRDRSVLVTLTGDLDLTTAGDLRTALRDALADGCDLLVVDLAGVTFAESVGLGVLIGVYKRARALRIGFVLWRPSPVVHRVLSITGLTRVFQIELREDVDPRDHADDGAERVDAGEAPEAAGHA